MASPVDAGRAGTNVSTASDPWTVNLPGSIAAGDTLLMFIRAAGVQNVSTPSGWSVIQTDDGFALDDLLNNSADASNDLTSAFWRKADGSEGATLSVDFASTVKGAAMTYRITGAADPTVTPPVSSDVVAGAAGVGTGANADPATVTPPGGSADYLFVAYMGLDGETQTISAAPSGYANLTTANSGTGSTPATNCVVGSGSKQATGSSENAGAFTSDAPAGGWTAICVAVYPTAGGTGHTEEPADTLSLTDAVAKARGLGRADTLSLADLFARVTVTARTVPDTVALADSATTAKTIPLAINDSVTLADQATPSKTIPKAVDDSLALTDARAHGRGLGLVDSLALADAVTKARGLALADSLSLADAATSAKTIPKAIDDTLALADQATPDLTTGGVNHTVEPDDDVALTDARAFDQGKAQADSLALADNFSRVTVTSRTVPDTLALSDQATTAATYQRTVTDSVTLADNVDPEITTGAQDHTVDVDDSVALSDAVALGRGLTQADTLALSDARAFTRGLNRADALALTDNFTRLATYQRTPTEQVLLADLFARVATAERTFTDAVTLSDLVEPEVPGDLQIDDVVALSDQLIGLILRGEICTGRIDYGWRGSMDGERGQIAYAEGGVIDE